MKKKLNVILLASILFLPVVSVAASVNKIVAVVNNEVITESQVQQQMEIAKQQMGENKSSPSDLRKQVLEYMINQAIQLQYAKSIGIQVSDEVVQQAVTGVAQKNGLTLEQLKEELKKQGMSYARYQQEIRNQMIIGQLQQRELAGKVKVDDREVNDLARVLANKPREAAEYRVADLLIAVPEGASAEVIAAKEQETRELLDGLRKNPTMKLDKPVQDLGFRKLNDFPELFIKTIQGMKPGEFAGPVRAENGFHILHLFETKGDVAAASVRHAITETEVRHIFMKPNVVLTPADIQRRLKNIRRELEHGGGNFAKLAAQYSQDLNTSQKGGNLGWVRPGMFDQTFEQIIDQLKPGQISQPFATSTGWHLVQVIKRRQVEEKRDPFKEEARQQIYAKKSAEVTKLWLKQLKADAYIKEENP